MESNLKKLDYDEEKLLEEDLKEIQECLVDAVGNAGTGEWSDTHREIKQEEELETLVADPGESLEDQKWHWDVSINSLYLFVNM